MENIAFNFALDVQEKTHGNDFITKKIKKSNRIIDIIIVMWIYVVYILKMLGILVHNFSIRNCIGCDLLLIIGVKLIANSDR